MNTKLQKSISTLRKILSQTTEYSTETPLFPIRLVITAEKGKLSQQMHDLRQKDPDFVEGEESELVEQFIDMLHRLVAKSDTGYRSLEEARRDVEHFIEMYPIFNASDFYIADARDEKFPVDIAASGQQVIPGVTKPYQWTIPGMGVDPTPEV